MTATHLKLLLLAGTLEARALAGRLSGFCAVTASLAGATRAPADYPCPVSVGGFGGPGGLADALAAGGYGALIDATHPFAARMAANAAAACTALGLPRLKLLRPEWRPDPADDWRSAPDLAAAAALCPAGARVFAAVGRESLEAFRARPDLRLITRSLSPPAAPLASWTCLIGPPEADAEAEAAVMRAHGVESLIVKNAGGAAGAAKLAAARILGLPVVMVARPKPPEGPTVETVAAAEAWARAFVTKAPLSLLSTGKEGERGLGREGEKVSE